MLVHQVAEELGIEGAAEVLESGKLDAAVAAADRQAKEGLDIRGVPHFVIGSGPKKTTLHGAQSIQTFEQALKRHLIQLAATAESV